MKACNRQLSPKAVIEALKISYGTSDVKEADEIFDGESGHSFIVDDTKFVTVFYQYVEMEKFYLKALENDNPMIRIDFMDRYLGKNIWKKYINEESLKQYLLELIKGKNVGTETKYEIEKRPIQSLKLFFPNPDFRTMSTINSILLKFTNKKLISDAFESALMRIKTRLLYLPEIDEYAKAYEWSVEDEED